MTAERRTVVVMASKWQAGRQTPSSYGGGSDPVRFIPYQDPKEASMRPASGVRGDDGFYHARPSALYTPTGPFGRSVASVRRPRTTIDAPTLPTIIDLSALIFPQYALGLGLNLRKTNSSGFNKGTRGGLQLRDQKEQIQNDSQGGPEAAGGGLGLGGSQSPPLSSTETSSELRPCELHMRWDVPDLCWPRPVPCLPKPCSGRAKELASKLGFACNRSY
ncbi:hypothetical protein THAOC_37902, partial [Thalassiosira oceanica]